MSNVEGVWGILGGMVGGERVTEMKKSFCSWNKLNKKFVNITIENK